MTTTPDAAHALADETAPKRIWLNTAGSYADAYDAHAYDDTGVTWCVHPVDDGDQEYVRADILAAALRDLADAAQERDRLAARVRELEALQAGPQERAECDCQIPHWCSERGCAARARAALGEGGGNG